MEDLDFLNDNFSPSSSDVQSFSGETPKAAPVQEPTTPAERSYNSTPSGYSNNNNNGGNKSWGNKPFDKEAWIKKQNEVQEPYLPVAVYIDYRQFTDEIKNSLVAFIDKLLSLGITVRFNADNKEWHDKIMSISNKRLEPVVPFDEFDTIRSKFGRNTKTSESIAKAHNPYWDKLPKIVKYLSQRNVRLLFGERNFNNAKFLITWSPDGARTANEVTRETGHVGDLIKLADKFMYPVYNINNRESVEELKRILQKGEQR